MNLPFVRRRLEEGRPARSSALPLAFQQYVEWFKFGGHAYGLGGVQQTLPGQKTEDVSPTFEGLGQAYQRNGVVFACLLVRMLLFSEARFQFRQMRNGRPGDLFGTAALAPLERPGPNATTGDLLARVEQDSSLAGNHFSVRRGERIVRLRPDWMTIVAGSPSGGDVGLEDIDAQIVGYLYHPGGRYSGEDPVALDARDVAHFAPIPDPQFRFRGMSWLTPVITDIMADQSASEHKLRFFENGATINHAVVFDKEVVRDVETFEKWVDAFEGSHAGLENAYKTLYLAAGSDVKAMGADMRQLDFKATQGAGETRIAAAAGVPPVIVGLSEGLNAATYSNYAQARRRFADGTMRPLWRNCAASFEPLVDVPAGAELWYDDRDIPFLREDARDAAEIQQIDAQAIRLLVDAGFTPESVVAAITAQDLERLVHTGLTSVQLLPPGTVANGNGAVPVTDAA